MKLNIVSPEIKNKTGHFNLAQSGHDNFAPTKDGYGIHLLQIKPYKTSEILLPTGIAVKIDENEQVNFAIQTCLADGCYASVNIEQNLLNEFKSGVEAKVGFKTIDQRQLAVKLSLKGFRQAIDSLQK